MLPSWCKHTVIVSRAPLVTTNRREERDWAHAQQHAITGCSVQPSSTSTSFGTVDATATADAILYAPYGADVAEGDRIQYGGATFVVSGIPYKVDSPTGLVSHLQARLRKWAG